MLTAKGHEGILGDGHVLNLDGGGGYVVYTLVIKVYFSDVCLVL